jgi:fructokinase
VVGEAMIDLVQAGPGRLFDAVPGGSPANVAIGLARLETPVRMVARLGDDLLGRRLREHLTANRVDLSLAIAATEPSSLAIVAVGRDGRPEYEFRIDGTADWQWRDEELAYVVDPQVVAVHAGSLALTLSPGADAIVRLLRRAQATATVSYDPNCRPLLMGLPADMLARVQSVLGFADVVKASAEDLEWLLPGRAPRDVAAEWLEAGPALVAITLGSDGVVAASRGSGLVRRPGRPVRVVDTVGAGDAFTSGLLSSLHRRSLLGAGQRERLRKLDPDSVAQILDDAVLASAIACTRRGAEPPTLDEIASAPL